MIEEEIQNGQYHAGDKVLHRCCQWLLLVLRGGQVEVVEPCCLTCALTARCHQPPWGLWGEGGGVKVFEGKGRGLYYKYQ
jgi:hypothetical protein